MPFLPDFRLASANVSDNARGIAAMLVAMAVFITGDTIIKAMGGALPIGEILFVRGLFASALILALARARGALTRWRLAISPMMAVRTAAEMAANVLFFMGLMRMKFADVAAIGQVTPLAVTAGAALLLGETVGWRRWLATLVGLGGVLIIIRPGTSAFDWSALFIVGVVICATARDLITRRLDAELSPLLITAFSAVGVTIAGLMVAPFETWVVPTPAQFGLLAITAVCILAGYYAIVLAMRIGEVAVVVPFRYSSMLFAIVGGYLVFAELPDRWTLVGLSIVVAAGLYTFHRERVVAQRLAREAEAR